MAKKSFQLLTLLMLAVPSILWAQVVENLDPKVSLLIRSELGKPTGDITADDLSRVTTLNLRSNQLTSLTLPDGLTSLTSLNLGDNNLTSLILPHGLTSLTTLNLEENNLTSLTLPEGLTSLTELKLWYNQLTDFSFLEGLTSLTTLGLVANNLTSLTLPEGLTSLTELNLRINQLMSLRLPEGLTSLTTLRLEFNPIELLSVPIGFNLKNVHFGFNKYAIAFYIPITIERAGNNIEITWTEGLLQSIDALGGEWNTIEGATSPHEVEINEPHKFFRAMQE